MRTFKMDHIAAPYARCVLRRAATPGLSDLSPRSELADRARFVADDETQHEDDLPGLSSPTYRHLIRPIHFQHGEQQTRLSPCGSERRKSAERKLKVGEPRDRRCVGVGVG